MRGLTLTQPWAQLVALLAKLIETRSWSTSYRGRIAIHAGAGLGPVGGRTGLHARCAQPFFVEALQKARTSAAPGQFYIDELADSLPRGEVVAVAELVDCVPTKNLVELAEIGRFTEEGGPRIWLLTDQERAFGDYSPGRYGWLLADVRPLRTPVRCRGALGLWAVPADVRAAIEAQL